MGTIVAIIRNTRNSCYIDNFLSRIDIAYLAHVGGVLQPQLLSLTNFLRTFTSFFEVTMSTSSS
jgi:hypothetical protein